MSLERFYSGKRVLLTGHTGFKGSWLAEWLLLLGADVSGYSLSAPTKPSLYEELNLVSRLRHVDGDVRDLSLLSKTIKTVKPDFVFHLAAQPIVSHSYRQPVDTFATNVMGTVNLLEAVRVSDYPCTVLVVTTDKCYENREWVHSYREEDVLGGYDPYSASKGAAELITASYRRSFFSDPRFGIRLATARAGNVIGGGDWALDRIVPDCIRALIQKSTINVRNPRATRPWQHVLDPLSGYLWLAAVLSEARPDHPSLSQLASAFNFGPSLLSNRSVGDLVREIIQHWPGDWNDATDPNASHEALRLNLATDKAYHMLGWRCAWNFEETVRETIQWYRMVTTSPDQAAPLTQAQIRAYSMRSREQGIEWAV